MMPLKTYRKKSLHKKNIFTCNMGTIMLCLFFMGCTSLTSAPETETLCRPQTTGFIDRVNCMVQKYNALPENQRASQEDLDKLFIDQAVYLADQVASGQMTEQEAELELSKTRTSIQTQRDARRAYMDRGRFGVGVGVGAGHHGGYWGGYDW